MTVKEFVKEYNSKLTDQLKARYIKETLELKTTYIPYIKKTNYVENLIFSTSLKDNDGVMFQRDMCAQHLLYVLMMIDLYTNIDIVYGDELYPLSEQYDELVKNNLIDVINSYIPETEINCFKNMIDLKNEDVYLNYGTLESYIVRKLDSLVANTIVPNINAVLDVLKDK